MTRSENLKPTKELILDAAFSFLEQPRYTSFSMNELAEKVGITKPAIYRHFKNKEVLLDNRLLLFLGIGFRRFFGFFVSVCTRDGVEHEDQEEKQENCVQKL